MSIPKLLNYFWRFAWTMDLVCCMVKVWTALFQNLPLNI